MAKKETAKKQPEKKKKSPAKQADTAEKKKIKPLKIILPVVAVVLVAAILVTGYFFWYKPRQNISVSGGGSKTKQTVEVEKAEVTYETADYNGYTVPSFVAEILTAADEDSEAACEQYGVAMTVAGHEISEIEFGMIYYDMFIYAIDDEIDDANGMIPSSTKAPADQAYGSTDYTWSDRLKSVTCDKLKQRYLLFYEALSNGFLVDDDTEAELEQSKETVETYAGYNLHSADEDLAASYFEGVTLNLYVRNMIIKAYAEKYEEYLKDSFGAEYSDDELTAVYKKDPAAYNYVDLRVFVIFQADTEYIEKAEKEVTDLDSFFAFGRDYYSMYSDYADYQDEDTQYYYRTASSLTDEFGSSIADWAFDSSRKAGDVSVIRGVAAYCLVYMVKTQYMLESFNYHDCTVFYNDALTTQPTDDEEKYAHDTLQEQLDILEKCGESERTAKFEEIAGVYDEDSASYYTMGKMEGVRATDVEKPIVDWVYAEDRKAGDLSLVELSVGYDMVMFDGINKGDYDYYPLVRSSLADADFDAYYESLVNFDGNECELNNESITAAAAIGESSCAAYAQRAADRQAEEQTSQTAS